MVSTLSAGPIKNDFTTQMLGVLGVIGSPLFAVTALLSVPNSMGSGTALGAVVGLAFLWCWMCSLTAMRRLRATGNGKGAQWLFVFQIITLSLASCQQIQEAFQIDSKTMGAFYNVCDLSWPISMTSMLVVFGFIMKAKVWHGWRRWPALLWGLSLPCFFAAMPLLGREKSGGFFLVPVTLGFLLFSLAVCTDKRERITEA